jgi:hypothetical protein
MPQKFLKGSAALALFLAFLCPTGRAEERSGISAAEWRSVLRCDTLDLFLKGRCVGFCRQSYTIHESGKTIEAETDLNAGGAKEAERLFAVDRRVFGFDGRLISASQELRAAEGASQWHLAKDTGATWNLTVTSGGVTRVEPVQGVVDNLTRIFEMYRGIKNRSIGPGNSFSDTTFDLTSGTPMTEVTRCIEVPSPANGFLWIFSDLQSAVGRIDTLKIDTAGATIYAGQFPFVMKKRGKNETAPIVASLWEIAETLSVQAPRAAGDSERIALVLDSTLSPDSSVLRFYGRQGSSWVLGDLPAKCPAQAPEPASPEAFISPTVTMQSDNPKIRHLADSLVKDAHTRCDSIDVCFHWVYRTLVKKLSPTFSNALETLEAGYGDCSEHSVLLGALLRAVGIPARVVLGLVYNPGKGYYYHAWVVAESGGSWLFVDPALGVFPASRDRVPLLIDDSGSESVKLAKFIGRIEIEYVKRGR